MSQPPRTGAWRPRLPGVGGPHDETLRPPVSCDVLGLQSTQKGSCLCRGALIAQLSGSCQETQRRQTSLGGGIYQNPNPNHSSLLWLEDDRPKGKGTGLRGLLRPVTACAGGAGLRLSVERTWPRVLGQRCSWALSDGDDFSPSQLLPSQTVHFLILLGGKKNVEIRVSFPGNTRSFGLDPDCAAGSWADVSTSWHLNGVLYLKLGKYKEEGIVKHRVPVREDVRWHTAGSSPALGTQRGQVESRCKPPARGLVTLASPWWPRWGPVLGAAWFLLTGKHKWPLITPQHK